MVIDNHLLSSMHIHFLGLLVEKELFHVSIDRLCSIDSNAKQNTHEISTDCASESRCVFKNKYQDQVWVNRHIVLV